MDFSNHAVDHIHATPRSSSRGYPHAAKTLRLRRHFLQVSTTLNHANVGGQPPPPLFHNHSVP
jgi:hypothetical protein